MDFPVQVQRIAKMYVPENNTWDHFYHGAII